MKQDFHSGKSVNGLAYDYGLTLKQTEEFLRKIIADEEGIVERQRKTIWELQRDLRFYQICWYLTLLVICLIGVLICLLR
jgi:hypothetical protein